MHDQKHDAKSEQESAADDTSTPSTQAYPLGRGYGHDYMRGGEVFGGYGYSSRPEYAQRRGEQTGRSP